MFPRIGYVYIQGSQAPDVYTVNMTGGEHSHGTISSDCYPTSFTFSHTNSDQASAAASGMEATHDALEKAVAASEVKLEVL